MKELNNIVTRLESICRKTIEDVDKSDCDNIVGRLDEPIDEKALAYCYNCKSTFSYDKKTLDESETMSVKCPTCGTDICLLD